LSPLNAAPEWFDKYAFYNSQLDEYLTFAEKTLPRAGKARRISRALPVLSFHAYLPQLL
jgi:hypothetical protein